MSTGMKKGCQKENWSRQQRQLNNMPGDNHLKQYMQSTISNELLSKLTHMKNTCTLKSKELGLVNGVIFIELSVDNANRAGEIRHLTSKEFKEGTLQRDGSILLKVKNHKTYYKHGPAFLTIAQELLPVIWNYYKLVRPAIATPLSPINFFLKINGTKLNTSSMRFYMQSVWDKIGLTSQVGPTLLRKAAVTKVHKSHPHKQKALAAKMNHSVTTAARYYCLQDKENNARDISSNLRHILISPTEDTQETTHDEAPIRTSKETVSESAETADPEEVSAPLEAITPEATIAPEQIVGLEQRTSSEGATAPKNTFNQASTSDQITTSGQTTTSDQAATYDQTATSGTLNWSAKNCFTEEEETHLITLFQNTILRKGSVMYQAFIQKKLNTTSLGRHMKSKFTFAKIKNKLNYIKYRKLVSP